MNRETPTRRKSSWFGEMLRGAADLIFWDWSTLLLFEVIYKYFLLMLSGYFQDIFISAMNYAGIISLTSQNAMKLLTTPVSALLLLVLIIIMVVAAYIEMAGVLLYFEDGRHGRKTGVIRLFSGALKKLPRLIQIKNAGLFPFLILILPLTGFALSSGPLTELRIPEFIAEFFLSRPLLGALYVTLFIGMYYLLFRNLFCLQGMVLSNEGFAEAGRECRSLMKGRAAKTLASLFFWLLVTASAAAVVYLISLAVLILSAKVFYSGAQEAYAFWFTYSKLSDVGAVLLSIFTMVCNLAVLTFLYYHYRDEEESILRENNTVAMRRYRERREWLTGLLRTQVRQSTGQWKNKNKIWDSKKNRRKEQAAMALRVVLVFFLVVLYSETGINSNSGMRDLTSVQVVAHRGGSYFAPENTLAALQEAKRSGAAYAEIDVQQTSDGVLVASHDSNLKRITGVDKNIWETGSGELMSYDAGTSFSKSYSGERIPTLEEMLRSARGEIGLMIELKNSGHSQGLEQKAVGLIHKHNAEKSCVIASMDYGVLERVKQIDPKIRTIYITAVAFGDFKEETAADAFSIEEASITPALVHFLHAEGKAVYAWTVNKEEAMRRMVGLEVDGIVTDNPYLAGYVLETGGKGALAGTLAEAVLEGGPKTPETMQRLNSPETMQKPDSQEAAEALAGRQR